MAPWTLFAALVASFALQVTAAPSAPCRKNPCADMMCIATHTAVIVPALQPGACSTCQCIPIPNLATRQTCVDDPCESVFCIATTNPTIIPGFGGACSTCECVPIQECPENPCEDTFCIATTNPTIIPGLGGACSTCECVPIGA